MALRYNVTQSSGNLNGQAAGSVVAGTGSIEIGDNARQKIRALQCLVTATANTASLTVAMKWQVSNDRATWVDASNGPQNAASVPFTTGTSVAKTMVISAPDSVYASRFARCVIVTGGATGAAADTYNIGYMYRTPA